MGQTHLQSLLQHPFCGAGHVVAVETNPATVEKLRQEFGVPVVAEVELQVSPQSAVHGAGARNRMSPGR